MVLAKLRFLCNTKYVFGICFVWGVVMLFVYFQNRSDFWVIVPGKSAKDSRDIAWGTPSPSLRPKTTLHASKEEKQECIIPNLKLSDPVMMKHFKKHAPTQCKIETDWVYVQNGTVRISPTAVKDHKGVSCDYYPLKRLNDYKIDWNAPVKNISDGFNMTSDAFKMMCVGKDGKKYDNVHHGVSFKPEFVKRAQDPLTSGLDGLGIAILGFDSMSRMSWLRRLPETRKYFVEKLGAIELESHNILGDGTTACMFPMLTGKFEWELPECRRHFKGAKTMDDFPWLWHEFKKAGYLTSWSNAAPASAPFNWRMLGFKDQPTDFYSRSFYLAATPRYKGSPTRCLRSRTQSRLWLDWFRDIFHMYKDQRKFLFHFITDMSHDDNNLLTAMDDDIKNTVQGLYEGNYLNNTLLILMGDHGARYFQVRSTVSGKLEERLPYFSFLFPSWFEKKYPDAIRNLRTNAKRLTTPFDLYYTFKEFLSYTGAGMGNVSKRGMSLFKEVPLSRSCKSADIAPHWCACLAWKNVSPSETGAKDALRVALDTINGYTSKYRSDCALLSVANVTMMTKLEMRSEVLKFTNTDANGGIYKINFSSKHKNEQTLYQITFFTSPGGAHFEVTVTHDEVHKKFLVNEKEISRINKYGNDSHCILGKNRQIRQYCYCKDNIKE